ncbi:MAG: Tfp pilus assembly protein PilX, partial [Paracoccaceae bacterium]
MRIRNQIHRPPTGREGIALAYAVFGTFVVASMVSVMFTMAGVSDKQADIKRGQSKARLLAEGALSTVEKDLQTALANWDSPEGAGTRTLAGVDIDFRVDAIGAQATMTDPAGIVRLVQPYEIQTRARVDGIVASAHKMINVEWTPLFQF